MKPARIAAVARFAPAAILGIAFGWTVFRFADVAQLLSPLVKAKNFYIERQTLPELAFQHIALCAITCLASIAVALPLSLLAWNGKSRVIRLLIDKAAAFGETFPTLALMAILVPALGYGIGPVAFALILYGILPILRNTLAGLGSVPAEIVDAARGCGMHDRAILLRIRLPLAMPLILQGIRISIVTNIAAATLGAAVGSGGLGIPIISGIRSFDTLLIIKGSLPVALLALFADSAIRSLETDRSGPAGSSEA